MLGQYIDVGPIIACTSTCKDLDSWWQQRDEFSVPLAHLTTGVPIWTKYSVEVTILVVSQCLHERLTLQLLELGSNYLKLIFQLLVQCRIVLDRVTNVEDPELG